MHEAVAKGFNCIKVGVGAPRTGRIIEPPHFTERMVEIFAAMREAAGSEVDLAIDFHGAVPPATAKLLIKALEPYQPMFVEEPINCQDHSLMAEIARGTHLPIATGERVFTKWGFREVLEKQAATVLQPDLCHAGGITECRLIAAMAEAYYATIAPHNPLGPISLAAGVQLAAAIPNFLCQAIRGEPITVFGDGSQTRSFCYVDDLVEGVWRLLGSGYVGPVNVGNPEEMSLYEMARTIVRIAGSRSEIVFRGLPPDDPKVRRPDVSLAREVLGWQPRVPVEEGLRRTHAWFARELAARERAS